jgi:hypothetical protein
VLSISAILLFSLMVVPTSSASVKPLMVSHWVYNVYFCVRPFDLHYNAGTYGGVQVISTQFHDHWDETPADNRIVINTIWNGYNHYSDTLYTGDWTGTYSPEGYTVTIWVDRVGLDQTGCRGHLTVYYYTN